jgi:hypothetical protein
VDAQPGPSAAAIPNRGFKVHGLTSHYSPIEVPGGPSEVSGRWAVGALSTQHAAARSSQNLPIGNWPWGLGARRPVPVPLGMCGVGPAPEGWRCV